MLIKKKILKLLRWFWVYSGSLLPSLLKKDRSTYLFLPINGAGLGHVSRALAVAKALRKQNPEAKIIFITTSIAVHLVYREGFTCYHVPPVAFLDDKIGALRWHILFYRCVSQVLTVHRPSTLVFDGSTPYIGLQRAMRRFSSLRYVWIKRGLYKDNVDMKRLEKETTLFDQVIVPSELGESSGSLKEQAFIATVPPIVGQDLHSILSREKACTRLRLDISRPRVYVQLGAGNINGINDIQERVVRLLRAHGYQVVVGQSPIALNPQRCDTADQEIIDYPNSRYFAGFDFAVLAAGYNSVCEAVALNLPTIFLPNQATKSDDQVKRAALAASLGPSEYIIDFTDEIFMDSVSRLRKRIDAGEVFKQSVFSGASDAAKLVAGENCA